MESGDAGDAGDLMRKWAGLAGILLSLGILGFIVYRLDLGALGRALAGAQYAYLVPLVATSILLQWVSALQWRYVLSPVKWVRTFRLFAAQMVGALARGLVQVQVGGLVKAYVVARRERLSLSTVLATTITDHLVHGLTFLGLLGVVLGVIDLPLASARAQTALRTAGLTTLVLDLGLLAVLVVLAVSPVWGARTVARMLGHLPTRWAAWAAEAYARFRQGICLPARWRERILLLVYGAGRTAIAPVEFYWLARALGLHLPWSAYPFLVVSLSFLAFLSSSLGIRGGFQAGMILVLGFYSVPKEVAVAMALIFAGVSRGTTMGLGLLFLWVEGITKEELRTLAKRWGASTDPSPTRVGLEPPAQAKGEWKA
jgi:glycosyltransferase 2 family protein